MLWVSPLATQIQELKPKGTHGQARNIVGNKMARRAMRSPAFSAGPRPRMDTTIGFLRGVGSFYAILDRPCAQFGCLLIGMQTQQTDASHFTRAPHRQTRSSSAASLYLLESTVARVSAANHTPHFFSFHPLLLFLNSHPEPYHDQGDHSTTQRNHHNNPRTTLPPRVAAC